MFLSFGSKSDRKYCS